MRYRTRRVIAVLMAALAPLLMMALGVRRELDRRLTSADAARGSELADVVRANIAQAGLQAAARLAALRDLLADDNRYRLAAVDGSRNERPYLLDYASQAMRTTGLGMLQIEDANGRILSSGQFRNQYDAPDGGLARALGRAGGQAVVEAATPEGSVRVLARLDTARVGGRTFLLIGGSTLDSSYISQLSRDPETEITLDTATGTLLGVGAVGPDGRRIIGVVPVAWVGAASDLDSSTTRLAQFTMRHDESSLVAVRRGVDRWVIGATLVAIVAALIVAWLMASRVSAPVTALAQSATALDLDRLDVPFATDRSDEIGDLSRVLASMTRRLRASVARVRDAERRATIGDLARQVTHDVKNGLVPLRHVVRHLAQVENEDPSRMAMIFAERRPTLEASINYLETLARSYTRLSPAPTEQRADLNSLCRDVAAALAPEGRDGSASSPGGDQVIRLELAESCPAVAVAPLSLRRVLENLIANALDALQGSGGHVVVTTSPAGGGLVRLVISDTGCGMSREQLARACDDFFTTKPGGTGLGLSIVRRVIIDAGGTLDISSDPGQGTRVTVTLRRA
jgi:signal transduction histidine kinase